jgi:hypothetical protein
MAQLSTVLYGSLGLVYATWHKHTTTRMQAPQACEYPQCTLQLRISVSANADATCPSVSANAITRVRYCAAA